MTIWWFIFESIFVYLYTALSFLVSKQHEIYHNIYSLSVYSKVIRIDAILIVSCVGLVRYYYRLFFNEFLNDLYFLQSITLMGYCCLMKVVENYLCLVFTNSRNFSLALLQTTESFIRNTMSYNRNTSKSVDNLSRTSTTEDCFLQNNNNNPILYETNHRANSTERFRIRIIVAIHTTIHVQ